MPAAAPITASLTPYAAEGISLYVGQECVIDLFDVITVRHLGDIVVPDSTGLEDPYFRYTDILRITGTPPAGLTVSSAYGNTKTGKLTGTPTTVGTSSVLFKIELSDYLWTNDDTPETNTVKAVGYISVPITVVAVPTTATPAAVESVILANSINAVIGSNLSYTFSAAISSYGVYWNATGLPPGLNLDGSTLRGVPTEIGTTTAMVSLRYKLSYDGPFITETKAVIIVVTAPIVGSEGTPVFIAAGGIDVFLDLQSMALSLDLPKTETIGYNGYQVINPSVKQLVVKPDQILNLNVRFTKGITVVDPDPSSMRFGIGTKIGGPLLMLGSTFTKVGSGSAAYFKMRVTSDNLEFDAVASDYYDEDAVEAVAADNMPAGDKLPTGLCELEFSTGSGASLAIFRSDSLAVLIRRSLLAGI